MVNSINRRCILPLQVSAKKLTLALHTHLSAFCERFNKSSPVYALNIDIYMNMNSIDRHCILPLQVSAKKLTLALHTHLSAFCERFNKSSNPHDN